MSKIKILSIAVIALIIINISTLVFFISKAPMRPKFKAPKEIVIHNLHFNKSQIKAYNELIKNHSNKINKLDHKIEMDKKELYKMLTEPASIKKNDSIMQLIALHKVEIEKAHFNHFLDIKALCSKEQMPNFNKLAHEINQVFMFKKRQRPEDN